MSWVRENRYRNWIGRQGRAALWLSKDGLVAAGMGLRNPKQQRFQIVPYLMTAEYKYLPFGLRRDLTPGQSVRANLGDPTSAVSRQDFG